MVISRTSFLIIFLFSLSFPHYVSAQSGKVKNKGDRFAPFYGKWSRDFTIMMGFKHKARYQISTNRIHYKLNGSLGNAEYTIMRDRFLAKNNRFVGHTKEGTYFVIFFKITAEKDLMLYKREVHNLAEGLKAKVPSASDSENRGWNTYKK